MPEPETPRFNVWPLTIATWMAILVFAVGVNLFPPNLAAMSETFHMSEGLFGAKLMWIGPLLFGIFTIVWGVAGSRFSNSRNLLVAAMVILGASLGLYAWRPVFLLIGLAAALLGISGSGIELMGCVFMAQLHPKNKRRFLNYSQCFFALGASATPLFAGQLLDRGYHWRVSFRAGAALAVATIALIALSPYRRTAQTTQPMRLRGVGPFANDRRYLFILAAMFFYVGGEMGVARWVPDYFAKTFGRSNTISSLSLSLFWLAMFPGRLIAGTLSHKVSTRAILVVSAAGGTLAMTALLLAGENMTLAFVAVLAMGFFLGSIWPTLVALTSTVYNDHLHLRVAIIMGGGALGSAIISPAIGWIRETVSFRAALMLPPVSTAVCLVMILLATRKDTPKTAVEMEE